MQITRLFTSVVMMLAFAGSVFANGITVLNTGARNMGMGGATVAYVQDGTAIAWNPAALGRQGNSVMFSMSAIMPSAIYTGTDPTTASFEANDEGKIYALPNLFGTYRLNDQLILGLGVYLPAGLGIAWKTDEFPFIDNSAKLESEIGAVSISPSIAYSINDQLSIGLAINVYYAMFTLYQATSEKQYSSGMGYGATFGVHWQATEKYSTGLSIRLPATLALSGDGPFGDPSGAKTDFDLDVPLATWIGWGNAYQLTDGITFALDLHYTMWSEMDVLKYKFTSGAANGLEGPLELKWEDALQIRFGGNYVLTDNWEARLGYTYDPAPSPDETHTLLFPSMDNHVIGGGFSYIGESFQISAALEYLIAEERNVNSVYEQEGQELPYDRLEMPILAGAIDVVIDL
jgi:long-chain fatty acid transport protein